MSCAAAAEQEAASAEKRTPPRATRTRAFIIVNRSYWRPIDRNVVKRCDRAARRSPSEDAELLPNRGAATGPREFGALKRVDKAAPPRRAASLMPLERRLPRLWPDAIEAHSGPSAPRQASADSRATSESSTDDASRAASVLSPSSPLRGEEGGRSAGRGAAQNYESTARRRCKPSEAFFF